MRADGGVPLPFDPESAPGGVGAVARSPTRGERRRGTARSRAPRPAPSDRNDGDGRPRTCVPRGRPATRSSPSRCRSGTSRRRSCARSPTSLAPTAMGSVRTTHDQNLVLRWVRDSTRRRLYRGLAAVGLARGGATPSPTSTSCPGAETCRLAVTPLARPRAHPRRPPRVAAGARRCDRRPATSRSAAARTAAASTTWPASASRAACGRSAGVRCPSTSSASAAASTRAARASAGWSRRCRRDASPSAVERLLDHAARERPDGETTRAFLQRADVDELRSLLADLEAFDPAQAGEEDYVDPGEEETAVTPGAA